MHTLPVLPVLGTSEVANTVAASVVNQTPLKTNIEANLLPHKLVLETCNYLRSIYLHPRLGHRMVTFRSEEGHSCSLGTAIGAAPPWFESKPVTVLPVVTNATFKHENTLITSKKQNKI